MDDILYKSLIYDFYNELLTQKQRDIYELYHHHDLSLSEISIHAEITPQAVSDILKRSEKALLRYENKLKFAQDYVKRHKIALELSQLVDWLDVNGKEDIMEKIKNKISLLME